MAGGAGVIALVPEFPPNYADIVAAIPAVAGMRPIFAWGDLVYNGAKAAEADDGIKVLTNERYARVDTSVTGLAHAAGGDGRGLGVRPRR